MSYTWSQAREEIRRLLKDSGNKFENDLLLDAMNRALEAYAAHTAIASASDVTFDGTSNKIALPDNLLDDLPFQYLWDETSQMWWTPTSVIPGSKTPDPTPNSSATKTYYEWPKGTINLQSTPAISTKFVLYYFAYWDTLYVDESIISVPKWAREALAIYSAAYALVGFAVSSSNIRQWNEKNDSGQPEHNPLLRMRESLMKTYQEILNRHPIQEKVPPFEGLR